MNKRIIYPTDIGGVAIIVPAPDARGEVLVSEAVYEGEKLVQEAVYRDETDDEFIARIAAKDVPPVVVFGPEGSVISSTARAYKIVDVADIPTDRTFRNAWEYQE
jgi:hypothetical protein